MSDENVEVIRRGFERLVSGDADATPEVISDDFELRSAMQRLYEDFGRGDVPAIMDRLAVGLEDVCDVAGGHDDRWSSPRHMKWAEVNAYF